MKLLLIVSLVAAVSASPAKDSFKKVGDLGYYKVIETKKSWKDAFEYCNAQEAHLAVVNSPEEAEALVKLMAKKVPYYAHIGFSSLLSQGHYVTLEGKDIDHSGYSKWEGGLRTTYAWRCGAMTPAGELTSRNCEEQLPFVCERDITSDWLKMEGQGSSYKLHKEKVTWAEALHKCHLQGATLTVMNSDAEATFVTSKIMKSVKSVHVGIQDAYAEASYFTVNGVTVNDSGYNKWVPQQPYKTYDLNHVAMDRDGLYLLEDSSNKLPFICEKHL